MAALLLVALLLWVPGALLRRRFGLARSQGGGTAVLAVEAALSLGFLSLVLLPVYLARAPVIAAPLSVAAALLALTVAALRVRSSEDAQPASLRGAPALELVLFALAIAVLLPATLAHSGANVDDWWDLSFVRGWLAAGHFGFSQMALTADPDTGASAVHPRFLWSGWLMLQALVAWVSGAEPWRVQAGALAGVTSVLLVSAQTALAGAVFRDCARRAWLVAATAVTTAAWVWGTEALPLFVRGYQDKLFAAFVLAPVLLALVTDASRGRREGRGDALAIALVAFATVSVHSLVYTMALFVAALVVLARQRGNALAWAGERRAVVAALLVPALYPLAQALLLATTFGEQGISLANPDNPVVRAHLALNRLLGTGGELWIVQPSAVFGSVALLIPLALVLCWRRRAQDAPRLLLAMTLVPCLLLFVPGLAALAGKLWVPWMLYRLGWFVPVPLLLAWLLVEIAPPAPAPAAAAVARRAASALVAVSMLLLAGSTAADRLRRDLREHPGPPVNLPTASALAVYDLLEAAPGRAAVLAPPNFSELVPAITGKPVLAFSERGTLVFSGDDARAYERLRDRASFFSSASDAAARDAIAERYGARWAVLPRRLVGSGSEETWLWRFGPEALLASLAADDAAGQACDGELWCRGWWSATRASVEAGLTPSWSIVLETRDWFVAERRGEERRTETTARAASRSEDSRWLAAFDLSPSEGRPASGDLLASATGAPGAIVGYDIPPRYALPSVSPIWLEGPGAWEDCPAEVSVRVDLGVACRISAIELQPHLPRERREVLELAAGGRSMRAQARHGEPLLLRLDDREPRSQVTVKLRSLLGSPVSIADLRVLGDRQSCGLLWPVHERARTPQMAASDEKLRQLAGSLPPGGRALVSLARHGKRDVGLERSVEMLREAVAAEPLLVEGWIELGFALDDLAALRAQASERASEQAIEKESADVAAALRHEARSAFHSAVVADSNSAWARGCEAWADRRAGHPLLALWKAVAAAQVDPLYGDAWTVAAYALGDLGLHGLSERALAAAEHEDPDRNWPVLARADLAIARYHAGAAVSGERLATARERLDGWLARHPFDVSARDKLAAVAALLPGGDGARP